MAKTADNLSGTYAGCAVFRIDFSFECRQPVLIQGWRFSNGSISLNETRHFALVHESGGW